MKIEIDLESAQSLVVEMLKDDAENLMESLGEDNWLDHDKDDFARDLNYTLGVLKRWMCHTEYEDFESELYGSDRPSAPQCDDEEFDPEYTDVYLDKPVYEACKAVADIAKTDVDTAASVLLAVAIYKAPRAGVCDD